jgi:hypothetical protein
MDRNQLKNLLRILVAVLAIEGFLPAQAPVFIPGQARVKATNAQTATSYPFTSADCGRPLTANNSSAQAYSLPVATSLPSNCILVITNIQASGGGTVTITPTTSTLTSAIGSNTVTGALALGPGNWATIQPDGTGSNYIASSAASRTDTTTPNTTSYSTGPNPPITSGGSGRGSIYGSGGSDPNPACATCAGGYANSDFTWHLKFGATDIGSASAAKVELCGTTVACAKTVQFQPIIVYGTAPLTSGTPSTATITGLPYTSTTSYVCTANDATAVSALKVANASASSTVITGPNTVTDTVGFSCKGT